MTITAISVYNFIKNKYPSVDELAEMMEKEESDRKWDEILNRNRG